MKPVAALLLCRFVLPFVQTTPDYSIEAIRYGTIPQFRVAGLVMGAPEEERMDIAVVVWLIRGEGRTILFDSGFFRQSRIDRFNVRQLLPVPQHRNRGGRLHLCAGGPGSERRGLPAHGTSGRCTGACRSRSRSFAV